MLRMIWVITFLQLFACEKENASKPEVVPSISIQDASKLEGKNNSVLTFELTLSETSTKEIMVDYNFSAKEAKSGQDFLASAGKVNFSAGSLNQQIEVTIIGDTLREVNESFEIKLLNPQNATLGRSSATGLIVNDDTYIPFVSKGYSTPERYEGYTLAWSDEFDKNNLNTSFWAYETGNGQGGWGNNELQYYQSGESNAFVTGGNLVIEARKESVGGFQYSSARIKTQGKKTFRHGRIDIRALLPEGQGIWPALWMLGANIDTIGWPACGEIDIMELVGHKPAEVHGTAHYGNQWPDHKYQGKNFTLPFGKFSDEFHVFSLLWDEKGMQWLVDDKAFYELRPENVSPDLWRFNKPFFFIFNVAVGGNWPGKPDDSTVFPQRMAVDYVRVFERD